MPARPSSPPYSTAFEPPTGVAVEIDAAITRVTAPNRGPYTFTGTNTFILGRDQVAVLDPGPADDGHFHALLEAIGGRTVGAILLTHTHKDHCGLARRLKRETGAPILSAGPHRLSRPRRFFEFNPFRRSGDFKLVPDRHLRDGETLVLDGMTVEVIATPGHCANHLCFAQTDGSWLFSGDHVMGWNSTLIGVPDGDLGDYLASLDKVIALPQSRYLPAHGGPIAEGRGFAQALKAHRLMRNGQIIEALGDGRKSISQLVARIYPNLRGRVAIAARQMLKAHLEYLETRGDIALSHTISGLSARLRG